METEVNESPWTTIDKIITACKNHPTILVSS
jgi:hypothetical protein